MLIHIETLDLRLVWINILLLLGVGLTPFSTALLGRYPLQPIADLAYGINAWAIRILFNVLWFYPRVRHLTHEEPNPWVIAKRSRVVIIGPMVYTLAIIFAFLSTKVSLGLYFSSQSTILFLAEDTSIKYSPVFLILGKS